MVPSATTRAGFLIAGGKSTRMGGGPDNDKVFLELGGQTLLQRALAAMNASCGSVTIVGDPAKFAPYGSVVADVFPGCGPLGGIHAALLKTTAEFSLMLAIDMPFIPSELLNFVFEVAQNSQATVTVPRVLGVLQPLCAVYRQEFAVVAERALEAGNFKVTATFSSLPVRVIDDRELAAAGFSEKHFFNLNTPRDRLAAETRAI